MTSPADIEAHQDAARPLGHEVIEMIGTLLAAAARMLTRVSGVGDLITAALMMLVVTIVTACRTACGPGRQPDEYPSFIGAG